MGSVLKNNSVMGTAENTMAEQSRRKDSFLENALQVIKIDMYMAGVQGLHSEFPQGRRVDISRSQIL